LAVVDIFGMELEINCHGEVAVIDGDVKQAVLKVGEIKYSGAGV
jgi:hypothetical protein